MKRTGYIKRRTPLRQVGARKLRTLDAEREFRRQVQVNAANWCQARTPACLPYRHEGHHAHHLRPSDRDRNVHDAAAGMWTCMPGHAWIHRHPAESYELGLLIRDGAA